MFAWIATAIALTGTILNVKKLRACFYLWTITNTMWLIFDIHNNLPSRAILDAVQLALAVWGIWAWKTVKDEEENK